MNSVIGALRVILGADTVAFEKGLTQAEKTLSRFGRNMDKIGQQLDRVGKTLTLGVTAPILALGAITVKTAADFETAMGKVSIATQATAGEMAKMETLARSIGKTTVFSASQSAEAMELLAKTGVSVEDILNGAAKATVDLAAATGSELDPAAAAVSDSMNQFGLKAAELPGIVNQITGAVNESKLDFDDFQLAMGQAGGFAASAGVSFKDFNAVLAGTSSMFTSGSDAGTSFKTFLSMLVPKTLKAANTMHDLQLAFFNADGSMKAMSVIAGDLDRALSGLSDEARTEALTNMFGVDGMRTAVGLMKLGSKGLDDISAKIAKTDAADQAAKRMGGFNGQLEQMKGSLEELAIAIGKSGLLQFATGMITAVTGFVDKLSTVSPVLLRVGVILAAVAAAVGPLLMAIGAMASGVGALMPIFVGLAGLLAGPVLAAIAPIALAVGALIAVFLLFRKQIVPVLQAWGKTVADVLGPKIKPLIDAIAGAFKDFVAAVAPMFAPGAPLTKGVEFLLAVWTRVFNGMVAALGGTIDIITALFKAFGALMRGDLAGVFGHIGEAVAAMARGMVAVFEGLFPGVIGWVSKMVNGVKTWLVDKLSPVFNWLEKQVGKVIGFFRNMWDAVVGHSYVPDMVEGIAEWMAKLDAGMVKPAEKATKKTLEAFEKLRDKLAPILGGLLSDAERDRNKLYADLAALDEGLKAGPGKGGISRAQYDEAVQRLYADYQKAAQPRIEGVAVSADPTLNDNTLPAGEVWGGQLFNPEQIEGMRTAFVSMGQSFVQAVKNGDLEGWFLDLADRFQAKAFDAAFNKLFDLIGKINWAGASGGGEGNIWQTVIGAVASAFTGTSSTGTGTTVGFKTGGSFKVGGSGPQDSKLVQFRATPGEMVNISHGNDNGSRGGDVFDLRGAVVTEQLLAQVNARVAAGTAVAITEGRAAARAVPGQLARANRQRLNRA